MRIQLLLILTVLVASAVCAHPGAAIAVAKGGVVYFVDTGAGVFSVDANGRLERREGPAFHWFAFDPAARFRHTPWPSIAGAEFRSAGNVVLSSDFPVVIGSDGRFYYPERTGGGHVRIVGIDPSGARSVRATLPPIRRGGAAITWLNGLAASADGSLYYTEDQAIRKIDPRGRVTTVVTGVAPTPCSAIPGTEAERPYLRGLAVAADGTIYVASAGCGAVLKVDSQGRVSTILRTTPPWSATAVAVDGRDVYVLEYLHTASDDRVEWIPRIRRIAPDGKVTTLSAAGTSRLRTPVR